MLQRAFDESDVTHPRVSLTWAQLAALAIAAVTVVLVFQGTFRFLYAMWSQSEEYSHGFIIPVVSAYLLWRRRAQFAQLSFRRSWAGVALASLGLALYFVGSLASIMSVDAYALVIVIAGCVLAVLGWEAFKVALVPIALLLLMNPIPTFFYNNLSLQLQLLSSQIGVAIMRLWGVSVFLEGNVIDLGTYKLQIAEACSGLRYLFPLMTLGVIVAYLFKGKLWMRWCLFLSTIPLTVFMNSLRIGIIGILVDSFGIAQAEGFLHLFEGWVIFMICFALLVAETWALVRVSGDRRPLRQLLSFDFPPTRAASPVARSRELGRPAVVVLLILLAAVLPARALPERIEIRPTHADFGGFPLQFGTWRGQRQTMEAVYLDTLKVDDYLLADFVSRGAGGDAGTSAQAPGAPVNLYVAYYASQRRGQSAHSPRSCLPGGGSRILEFGQRELAGGRSDAAPLRVNRVIVQHDSDRQLVYYWFQERGRGLTNEYLVKWYLLQDALLRNRSDGALVRLITPLSGNESQATADARLEHFALSALPVLQDYLPN
jgi:exosortase D (VPLPA-CTERM-specific)